MLIAYRFKDFPFRWEDGRESILTGGAVVAAHEVPGDAVRNWRAVRVVLDGVPPLCAVCRAKVELWLHETRRHNANIVDGLTRGGH
jgi:hypothetical protein